MKLLSIVCVLVLVLGLMSTPALAQDTDGDGVPDVMDNCPDTCNGAALGTCLKSIGGVFKSTGVTCTNNEGCELDEFCDKEQFDNNENTIGDACECYADVNCDETVALTDLVIIKQEFLRDDCPLCTPTTIYQCPIGMIICDDKCIDPMKDREYCGAGEYCLGGITCEEGEICVSGVCQLNCPPGLAECNGRCVDTNTDENYCGSCLNTCSSGEMCMGGSCFPYCTENCGLVPKTGQTISHADGDDGDLQMGVALPNPRFTDNNNGTVTDNLTGLLWLKDANCFGLRTWYQAVSDANSLADGLCGLTDGSNAGNWRLPNLREMLSIFDYGYKNPALPDEHPFTNLMGQYWTSTSLTSDSWTVIFSLGYPNGTGKSNPFYVLPVRN